MRSIAIKQGATLNGNFYSSGQIIGLKRFIKAAKYRGYTYDEVLEAWTESYGMKCERKRVHFRCLRAVFSTGSRRGFRFSSLSLAERLKLATSTMDPHDIKLCYAAFLETAMEVYGIKFGKEVAR